MGDCLSGTRIESVDSNDIIIVNTQQMIIQEIKMVY